MIGALSVAQSVWVSEEKLCAAQDCSAAAHLHVLSTCAVMQCEGCDTHRHNRMRVLLRHSQAQQNVCTAAAHLRASRRGIALQLQWLGPLWEPGHTHVTFFCSLASLLFWLLFLGKHAGFYG
jgi:hypothetical protein